MLHSNHLLSVYQQNALLGATPGPTDPYILPAQLPSNYQVLLSNYLQRHALVGRAPRWPPRDSISTNDLRGLESRAS